MNREDIKHVRVKVHNADGSLASDKLHMKSVKYEKGKKVYEAVPITKDMMTGKVWNDPNYKLFNSGNQRPVTNKIYTTTMKPILTTTIKSYIPIISKPILTSTMKPNTPLLSKPIFTATIKPYTPLLNKPVKSVTSRPKPIMKNSDQQYFLCKPLKNIDNSYELDPSTFNSKFRNEKFDFDWNNYEKKWILFLISHFLTKDFLIKDMFHLNLNTLVSTFMIQKLKNIASYIILSDYFICKNIM